MRLLLVIMILFSALTSAFTVEAADFSAPHNCAGFQIDDNCHDNGNQADDNCADCLHHCHASPSILIMKTSAMPPVESKSVFAFADHFLLGHDPAGLLRPPQPV